MRSMSWRAASACGPRLLLSLASLLFLSAAGLACGSAVAQRVGDPLPLPSGDAQSACERDAWIELVPTRVIAHEPWGTATSDGRVIYSQSFTERRGDQGVSAYLRQTDEPIPLAQLLPKLDEPALLRRHEARVVPVRSSLERSTFVETTGIVGMGVGVVGIMGGMGLLVAEGSFSDASMLLTLGSTGLVLVGSLVFAVGRLMRPDPAQITLMRVRELTLLPHENDMEALSRGVDRQNARVRQRCAASP